MMALFLREADVQQLLTMDIALAAVEEALRLLGEGAGQNRPRQRVRTQGPLIQAMPAALPQGMGLKFYCSRRQGSRFWIPLFDSVTGDLLSFMQADFLGMMRTGAASGVATRYLSRPDSKVMGVFGTGWQARSQVQAVAAVRPLERIKAYGRNQEKLAAFCHDMTALTGVQTVPAATPREVVAGSDIVGTITTAAEPLFDGSWLEPGTHINAAGSNRANAREVDAETVARADRVVVDMVEQARVESGDLIGAAAVGRFDWTRAVELGAVVAGRVPGRQSATEITLFESHGLAAWDIATARRVYDLAREKGLGVELDL